MLVPKITKYGIPCHLSAVLQSVHGLNATKVVTSKFQVIKLEVKSSYKGQVKSFQVIKLPNQVIIAERRDFSVSCHKLISILSKNSYRKLEALRQHN